MTKNEIIKKRYPFYNEDIAMKDIEINAEAVKDLMDDLIDEIVKMYVPDGNLEIWLHKIQKLRDVS
jgi:hypothetical protein